MDQPKPNPEVKAQRRVFTSAYKQRILAEIDAAPVGKKGEILRREGLYSSRIAAWRSERAKAGNTAFQSKRGPAARDQHAENARLRREVQSLGKRLAQAEAIIDIQKKISLLMGLPVNSTDSDENNA